MQQIALIHHCLSFTLNNKKYLYGLTQSLCSSESALKKVRIDHIILPSAPYQKTENEKIVGIFRWSIQALKKIKHKSVLISQIKIKEKICHEEVLGGVEFEWETYKQHGIKEDDILAEIQKRCLIQSHQQSISLDWFNCQKTQLKIIVPQQGTTTIMCHQTHVFAINPSEEWIKWLEFNIISLNHLYAVIISKQSSIKSILPLILLLKRPKIVRLVCRKELEEKIVKLAKKYLGLSQKMVRNKLQIRTVSYDPHPTIFPLLSLKLSFHHQQQKYPFIKINFGLKFFHIYHQTLQHYPNQLSSPDLEYLLCYGVHENLKKQLYSLPVLYRKKIILNRMDHKYNHKYFVTLDENCHCCTISANQKYKFKNCIPLKYRDSSWKVKQLQNQQVLMPVQMLIRVIEGCIRVNDIEYIFCGGQFENPIKIECMKNALIAMQPTHFYQSESSCLKMYEQKLQSQISQKLVELQQNKLIKQLTRDERFIMNRIGTLKTFEVGHKANTQDPVCVYFIVKGAMKWESSEEVCKTGGYIGNLNEKEVNPEIQVLKDTWVLQIPVFLFIIEFLELYPERFYQINSYGTIFH